MMQPTLQTERLRLVPAGSQHLDSLWALWRDPAVRRYLWDDREIAREEADAMLRHGLTLAPSGLGLWTIEGLHQLQGTTTTGESPRGCVGLLPVDTAATFAPELVGHVEPLVALPRAWWGHGYAQEALRAMLHYATTTLDVTLLAAVTDVPNTASDAMLRAVGFVAVREAPGPRHPLRIYRYPRDGSPARNPLVGRHDAA